MPALIEQLRLAYCWLTGTCELCDWARRRRKRGAIIDLGNHPCIEGNRHP